MGIQPGNKIAVHYVGKLEDNSIFDQTTEGNPFEFTVGAGEVILGFDKAVLNMELNEEKEVIIPYNEGYGNYDNSLIKEFPKENMAKDVDPVKNQSLVYTNDQGEEAVGRIIEVTNSTLIVDFNHPLAGKPLYFMIKILSIN